MKSVWRYARHDVPCGVGVKKLVSENLIYWKINLEQKVCLD